MEPAKHATHLKRLNAMTKKKYSKLAQIASMTCVIHCLGAPFIVLFLPIIGGHLHNMFLELGLLIASIGCGIFIIYTGYCKHKKKHASVLFVFGVVFWILHVALEQIHLEKYTTLVLIIGTLFILGSYYINHRSKKCCGTS